ncbi:antibiotic acetyltransferase [bacterium 1XD42-94]|nr:antibiotic acetyltransferase [bacterium 1XD42-76]NBK04279.1 antibiotic acetyltransferase [bacterium 1XD42-94]
MVNYQTIRKTVQRCIDEGWKRFIIFPFGENGMCTKHILQETFGITDIVIVDTELSKYNSKIKSVEELHRDKELCNNAILIIASVEQEIIDFAKDNILCPQKVNIAECKKDSLIDKQVDEQINEQVDKQTNIGLYSYGPLAIPNSRVERVGAFCSFAEGCDAVWNHQLTMVTNHDFIYENVICKEIDNQKYCHKDFNKRFRIGNDVWLGKNVILTNGCRIGNGVRVAAGAVVTKDLPDYCIAAGVPARIIGYRFNDEQIKKLNKIAWWDWDVEKIKMCYDDFLDIDVFLEKHYQEAE